MNKMLFGIFIFIAASNILAGELWSESFACSSKELTENDVINISTRDAIRYSTKWILGIPKSLCISVSDTENTNINALIYEAPNNSYADGRIAWDFKSDTYKDFEIDKTYMLTEKIQSDIETRIMKRKVTLVPEPALLWPMFLVVLSLCFFVRSGRRYFLFLSIIAPFACLADGVVSNVSCHQRYPWNGSVDIDYTLTATSKRTTPVFQINFYGSSDDGQTVVLLENYGKLDGEGAAGIVLNSGEHRVTWTPSEKYPSISTENMKVKVEASDVTEAAPYLRLFLDSGKMAPSTKAPKIEEGATCKKGEMWFRRIEAGTFTMGASPDEVGYGTWGHSYEYQHEVTISRAFYIGIFEVTQYQYKSLPGYNDAFANPSWEKGSLLPVYDVDWYELRGIRLGDLWPTGTKYNFDDYCVDPCSWIGRLREKTGNGLIFDLPTEAQWEYACRGTRGTDGKWNDGSNILSETGEDNNLGALGWYLHNRRLSSCPMEVGLKKPNGWGLYDMHGNVREWCLDYLGSNRSEPAVDPVGSFDTGVGKEHISPYRIAKGGMYSSTPAECRSAYYVQLHPGYGEWDVCGFRLVLVR